MNRDKLSGALAESVQAVQVLTGMFSSTTGQIDDRWQAFMKFQIARARQYFADAEAGVDHLDTDARWPVWSALILYRYVSLCSHIWHLGITSSPACAVC